MPVDVPSCARIAFDRGDQLSFCSWGSPNFEVEEEEERGEEG